MACFLSTANRKSSTSCYRKHAQGRPPSAELAADLLENELVAAMLHSGRGFAAACRDAFKVYRGGGFAASGEAKDVERHLRSLRRRAARHARQTLRKDARVAASVFISCRWSSWFLLC